MGDVDSAMLVNEVTWTVATSDRLNVAAVSGASVTAGHVTMPAIIRAAAGGALQHHARRQIVLHHHVGRGGRAGVGGGDGVVDGGTAIAVRVTDLEHRHIRAAR